MCNLYSFTKGPQAIRDFVRATRSDVGNMPHLEFPRHRRLVGSGCSHRRLKLGLMQTFRALHPTTCQCPELSSVRRPAILHLSGFEVQPVFWPFWPSPESQRGAPRLADVLPMRCKDVVDELLRGRSSEASNCRLANLAGKRRRRRSPQLDHCRRGRGSGWAFRDSPVFRDRIGGATWNVRQHPSE